MKLFHKKPKDERVVAEANRIYKIGYLILMVGANGLITTFRPILVGLNERF